MKPSVVACLGVLAFASLTHVSAQPAGRTVLRSVQSSVQGDLTIVTIEAAGALPQPVSGALDDPPRIFLDFTGVTPQASGTTEMPGGGAVKRVRVALYSNSPTVTRVALDLTRRETFRVERGRAPVRTNQDPGRVTIRGDAPHSGITGAAAAETRHGAGCTFRTRRSGIARSARRNAIARSASRSSGSSRSGERRNDGSPNCPGGRLTDAHATKPRAPRPGRPGGDPGRPAAGERDRELSPSTVWCARAARVSPIGGRRH